MEKEELIKFGTALEAVKNGKKVARIGWNGKNMFVYLNKGSIDISKKAITTEYVGGVSSSLFEVGDIDTITRMPNLNMKAADNSIITGWLASQTDMLAEDWLILD